jgi:hypothetical protein
LTIIDERAAEAGPDDVEHVMRTPDGTGDTTIKWGPRSTDEEVDTARKAFKRLRKLGYLAYKVDGEDRSQLHEFDPAAREIVMMTPHQGG